MARVEFEVAGFKVGFGWVGCEPARVGRGRGGVGWVGCEAARLGRG